MIRNEKEYQEAKQRIAEDEKALAAELAALEQAGLTPNEIKRALDPVRSFHSQLVEDVEWYEHVLRREFEPISRLTAIGRLLIALRIANGLSQRELAERLGVSEQMVSRDERNEYHGITVERAQRILDCLNETPSLHIEKRLATVEG